MAILWTGPYVVRDDLFSGDAAHHVFWFYQYANPALFPNDLSIEYFASDSVAPSGYRAFYAVLTSWFDAQRAAEWVAVVLVGLSGWLAWLLGRSLQPDARPVTGLLAVVALACLLPQTDLISPMGFQRSFALPMTLLCLWALVSRRYRWVGVSWLAAAFIYPVTIAVLGLASALVFLGDLVRDRRMPPHWLWNAVLGVLALGVIVLGTGTPENVGPMVTYAQAMSLPEFGPGGRQQLWGDGWREYWFTHHRTGLGWSPKVVAACRGSLRRRISDRRATADPARSLADGTRGSGLVVVGPACPVRPVPAKPPFPHGARRLLLRRAVGGWLRGHEVPGGALSAGAAREGLALGAAVVGAAGAAGRRRCHSTPHAVRAWEAPRSADLERVYAFLGELPVDTLVAAHPDLADYIPLRSRRSVLASTEMSIAFMTGYYSRVKPRIEASLRAAYATSLEEMDSTLRSVRRGRRS